MKIERTRFEIHENLAGLLRLVLALLIALSLFSLSIISAHADAATPPAAPTGLNATPGNASVTLSWNANNEDDLAGYNIYRSLTGTIPLINPINGATLVTEVTYTDNGLQNGTAYHYRITAVDTSANESTPSAKVTATPQDNDPPAAPVDLTATPGDTTVNLNWTSNTETDLAGYNVYRYDAPSTYTKINLSLVVTPSYNVTGLANGTAYTFVVTAVDNATLPNESGYSASATATPRNANQAPTDITLSNGSVDENQPAGTLVGTLGSNDPNLGDTFTYTLVTGEGSINNASFTISGNNLQTTEVFDYETKASYSIRVRTTDQGSLYFEKAFIITVTDVNDPPVITEGTSVAVAMSKNGIPTAFTLTLHAIDQDGDLLTWSITTPATNGTASISGTGYSKDIEYTPVTDYTGSDSFGVQVTDGDLSDSITVNVTISAATYNISGNAGVAGATISFTGGTPVTADGTGNFSLIVPHNWSGNVTPSLTGYTFSPTNRTYANVTSNQTGANFIAMINTYTMTVSKTGSTGTGTVTSTPPGINCGPDCSEIYNYGTSVTLTATPAPGGYDHFQGWSGGGCSGTGTCTVVLAVNTGVTAVFEKATFSDVPFDYTESLGGVDYLLYPYIEALWDGNFTAGCGTDPLTYCPDRTMNRGESSVFILRGNFGKDYLPPTTTGTFADDWTVGSWAEKWAEGMWEENLTAGCQFDPLKFCPWYQLPRVEGAVFGLRLKYGASYNPPAATGLVFADMTDTEYWGTKWAEKAYADGLLPACGTGAGGKPNFCPYDLLDRAWSAYLVVKAKNLPLP